MRLILTRHGETEENTKKVYQGHLPGKLTEKGKKQAKKVAKRLRDEKVDVIFSSDLARASETAKEIAKFHQEVPIYFVKELRERNMGKLQGTNKKDTIGWEIAENRDKIMEEAGAESVDKLVKRAQNFLEKLLENFNDKNILLVGHGGINHAIISNLLKQSWVETFGEQKPRNTSVTIFEFDDDKKPKLILFDCTKHLEEGG